MPATPRGESSCWVQWGHRQGRSGRRCEPETGGAGGGAQTGPAPFLALSLPRALPRGLAPHPPLSICGSPTPSPGRRPRGAGCCALTRSLRFSYVVSVASRRSRADAAQLRTLQLPFPKPRRLRLGRACACVSAEAAAPRLQRSPGAWRASADQAAGRGAGGRRAGLPPSRGRTALARHRWKSVSRSRSIACPKFKPGSPWKN